MWWKLSVGLSVREKRSQMADFISLGMFDEVVLASMREEQWNHFPCTFPGLNDHICEDKRR